MILRILDPGLCTLLVDKGRLYSRSLGLPVGGAADRFALAVGNALVGNAPDAGALEIALRGPKLVSECDLACVVYGAPFALSCAGHSRLTTGTTFTLEAGKPLEIAECSIGMRAYFCASGGLEGRRVMGSLSSLTQLVAGTQLTCVPGRIGTRFVGAGAARSLGSSVLRVLPGVQSRGFDMKEFFGQDYKVTSAGNRMGIRLRGRPLAFSDSELASEPVCPGSVQVTSDGQCIILGIDGQTIGGYPKIAQVISADLDKLGQLRPDVQIRFSEVGLEEARTLYLREQSELREWLVRLQVTAPNG
jgi:antagonist of KipI